MKKLVAVFAISLGAWFSGSILSAAELPVDAQNRIAQNYLVNPGFENGKYGWSFSGGATTAVNTTAKGEGNYGADWDSNSASQTLTQSVTVPAGLAGANGVAWCMFKVPSGSATHTIVVDDGSGNTLGQAATTINNSTSFLVTSVNFIFGASASTARLKITSVASNEPEIYIDSCFLGKSFGAVTSNVSQTQFIASGYFPATGSCTVSRTNTALGAFGTTAACPGPTVEQNPGPGTLQTTDVDLPTKFTVNSLPPGYYEVGFSGPITIATSAQASALAINDGTTTTGQTGITVQTNGQSFTVIGYFNYSSAANRTFELYASSAANALTIDITGSNKQVYFWVKRYPSTPELAYRPDTTPASWSGHQSVTAGCTSTNASFVNPSACTSTLTEDTNRNFGTVSQVASPANGISVTWPRTGRYLVCVGLLSSMVSGNANIRLVDGNSVVIASNGYVQTNTGASPQLCGIYSATAGAGTLLFQGAVSAGTLTIAANGAASGSNAVNWSIVELDTPMATPFLVGGLTSGSTGASERIERIQYYTTAYGTVCSSSPCGVTSSNSGITVTRNGTGDYTINFPAGTFSATPTCTVTAYNGSNTISILQTFASDSSTAWRFTSNNSSSGAAANTSGDAICMGPH